jgi:L-malate glycosyltransferase
VHVHDILPTSPVGAAVRYGIRPASALLAVSKRVAASLRAKPERIHVVQNPLDVARFATDVSASDARRALGLDANAKLLVMVGQITPWKGQDVAIRALARARRSHPRAALAIVGTPKFAAATARFDNRAYERELHRLVREFELGDAVSFFGERDDVEVLMRAADLVVVPSSEEPFGRTVIEGMAAERTVVASAGGGPSEIIRPGETGILVAGRDAETWGTELSRLLADPARLARIGAAARIEAARYDRHSYTARLLGIYRELARRTGS